MVKKRSAGSLAFTVLNTAFMLMIIIVTLYPILYVFFASISDPEQLVKHSGLIWKPLGFSMSSYRMVLKNPMIATGYQNTLINVVLGTAINLFMTSIGAYVLSRKGYMWKKALMLGIIFTMFFQGGMIPSFLLVSGLGLKDTRWALLIPGAISTYNLIIMRTSFQSVPDSLEESAKMDGAGDFTVLMRIVLPLSKPIIVVMLLYYGVAHWNSWFSPMIYLQSRTLYPLQLILREIIISSDLSSMDGGMDLGRIGAAVKYASIMVSTLPILAVYPFLQRYFVQGVMIGAVKE